MSEEEDLEAFLFLVALGLVSADDFAFATLAIDVVKKEVSGMGRELRTKQRVETQNRSFNENNSVNGRCRKPEGKRM